MSDKNDDYGYFGKGIDGYVHYKQAFDRNFPGNSQSGKGRIKRSHIQCNQNITSIIPDKNRSTPDCHQKQNSNKVQREPCDVTKHITSTDPFDFYDPLNVDDPHDIFDIDESENKHKPHHKIKNGINFNNHVFLWLALAGFGALCLIMLVPTLLGYMISGTASGADSFGGIFILVVGAILIALL